MPDQSPNPHVTPASVTVEVWLIELAASAALVERAYNGLPPDARTRAKSFRTPEMQRRHILAHSALRSLLAQKLNCVPQEITFQSGTHGKPSLSTPHHPLLHFNLSHSGELALVAISEAAEVGVDIEHIRPIRDPFALAKRFFTPGEQNELSAVPPEQQLNCFFRLWTQKEALLKATGQGIANGLHRFEVTSREGGGLVAVDGRAAAEFGWSLLNWTLGAPASVVADSGAVEVPTRMSALPGRSVREHSAQYVAACAVPALKAMLVQQQFTFSQL